MSTLSTSELISLMDSARFDAAGQLRAVIRRRNQVVAGDYRMVDPTNPLAFLMEMACAGAANNATHHEAEMRRRHPMLAATKEDLYFHLTDRQYLNAFAVPPETTIGMIIPIEDIVNNAVEIGNTGVKKLVLGKNSIWRVGKYEFTLEYPIEFKLSGDDGLTIGFGTPIVDPIHVLESNIIEPEYVNYQGYPSVRIYFPIRQMSVVSDIIRINSASSSVADLTYTDKFHFLTAYIRKTVGNTKTWQRIRVSWNEHAYDPYTPTLLVRDVGGILKLTIPVVYHTLDMIGDDIRIDVYTTKAENDVILSEFAESQWTVEPRDFDDTDDNVFSAPFERMNTLLAFSSDYTRNGRDELSFEELRERITEVHYGDVEQPITTVNHVMKLKDRGFSSVKATDGVTSRSFNATRTMPLPVDNYLVSPINVGVFNALFRPAELSGVAGIDVNGPRTTIHPSVLFKSTEGTISIVSAAERATLAAASGDTLARLVSASTYLFTPFYNVLDSTTDNFELRTYHLDTPEVNGRQFMADNPKLLLDLQTSQGVTLTRTATGYQLLILTSSGESYKTLRDDQIGVQLSFIPVGETANVVMLGKLISKDDANNRLWSFDIKTNHDLDDADELQVLNFISFGNGEVPARMPLTTQMDLCYYVNEYPVSGIEKSGIDRVINQQAVPAGSYGIIQERLKVTFGERVANLWTGARPIVLPEDYAYYDHDMPLRYTSAEYEYDAGGNLVLTMVNGVATPTLKHAVGDVMLDPVTGEVRYEYRVGDVQKVDGKPVIIDPRTLTRQLDLVLFDGLFAFANDRSSIQYVNYVRRNIVQWSREDMVAANLTVLEESVVKFRPTATIGSITCIVGEGGDVTLDARQSLSLKFLMTESGWKNENLKKALRKQSITTINTEFNKSSIATKNIITDLTNKVPPEVVGIELLGLGGEDYNYPLLTLKDGSGQPSIRMKLTALPDGTYTVEEDINITFVPHLPARSDR